MKESLEKLKKLFDQEVVERETWKTELSKLHNSAHELQQAYRDARMQYKERIGKLKEEVDTIQSQLAILALNDPERAKMLAEKMTSANAILKAAESVTVWEYCAKQISKERERLLQAYIDSKQAELVYFEFCQRIEEALRSFQRALQEREKQKTYHSISDSRYAIDNVADILVGEFQSEPNKPMPSQRQEAAMKRLLWRCEQEAGKNAQEIIEKRTHVE